MSDTKGYSEGINLEKIIMIGVGLFEYFEKAYVDNTNAFSPQCEHNKENVW